MLYETKKLGYEISGFDDVFENKNFIQLREVPQFLRETTLVVWVRWRQIFYIAKLCSSLLCEWSFCFSLHRTVCYECRSILQMDTVMYLVISFFSSFHITQCPSAAGVCVNCGRQLAISFQIDTTQSLKMFRFGIRARLGTSVDWLTVDVGFWLRYK